MTSRRVRRAARALAVAGVAALVTVGSPGAASAATEYDGEATALRIEGLRLELFPKGLDALPKQAQQLKDALRQLQSQAPEQLRRESLALVVPDQVIGHAEFPGADTQGAIPPNPLVTAEFLEARSVKARNGDLVGEASVAGLSLGGGVLSADVIKTSCTGNGQRVSLDISPLALNSNQDIVRNEMSLKPGTAVPIDGLGTITFHQADSDGSTYAEGTNVVIDLDSDLSVEALLGIFDSTVPAVRDALEQILLDLGRTEVGPEGERPLEHVFNEENLSQLPANQFEEGVSTLAQELRDGAQQLPEPAREALNNVAHLEGTITVANAACAQDTVSTTSAAPSEPQQAVPAQPVSDTSEPPLADTGSPAGMIGIGLAGIAALALGGVALVRLSRSSP